MGADSLLCLDQTLPLGRVDARILAILLRLKLPRLRESLEQIKMVVFTRWGKPESQPSLQHPDLSLVVLEFPLDDRHLSLRSTP